MSEIFISVQFSKDQWYIYDHMASSLEMVHNLPPPSDFILFCCPKDQASAEAFLQSTISSARKQCSSLQGYMFNDKHYQCDTELMLNRCVQAWFYITEDFLLDDEMQTYRDTCLMRSILCCNRKQSFIPVWTKGKDEFLELPPSLAAYTGLYEGDFKLVRRVISMISAPMHQ
jgi:hypothetical protein